LVTAGRSSLTLAFSSGAPAPSTEAVVPFAMLSHPILICWLMPSPSQVQRSLSAVDRGQQRPAQSSSRCRTMGTPLGPCSFAPQANSITAHYANRPGGAERPRLPLDSPHAASLRTPGPSRRERNFLIRSAIILLAVDGNILSLPAAIWSHASANLNLSIARSSCSPASLHSGA
jgi:hypothetical protein